MESMLTNRVAIVTGAGRGMGALVARTLAAAGARVAVNDLNPDRASRTREQIVAKGGVAVAIAADVANKFQCAHLIETTRAAWGRLDILVNQAHVAPAASILKMDEWAWERCLNVNLKGTFLMSQLCGRVMADENGARGGVIVNIAAMAGVERSLPDQAAFCASQAGIVGFTRECAREYAQYGIRVHALLAARESATEDFEQQMPQMQEAADAVRFFCSDAGAPLAAGNVIVDSRQWLQRQK